MLLKLLRRAVLDRELDDRALWGVAEMWRGWFLLSSDGPRGFCRLEAEIRGFARFDAERVRSALAAAAPRCDVRLTDSDTILIVTPPSAADQQCDLSGWLVAVQMPEAQGLFLILRSTIEGKKRVDARARSVNSIVLAGLSSGGKFLLKGLWPAGISPQFEKADILLWRGERAFLDSLDTFLRVYQKEEATEDEQRSDRPTKLERAQWTSDEQFWRTSESPSVFKSLLMERYAIWFVRQFVGMPDEISPLRFLRRCVLPISMIVVFGSCWLRSGNWALGTLAVAGILLLLFVVWTKLKQVLMYHRLYNRDLRELYGNDVTHEPVDWRAQPAAHDPYARKLSSELEAAGAVHCFDFQTHQLPGDLNNVGRAYILPDCHAYIFLSVLLGQTELKYFPALVLFNIVTYFDGNRSFTTITGVAYREMRMKTSFARALTGETDPTVLIRHHREDVRGQIAKGRVPKPVDPSKILETMSFEHDYSKRFYANRKPYSWGDALHEAFGIDRKPVL
jgi:hypothetical protein